MKAPADPDNAPASVGLVGDGDEIAAISDVEAAFGITLDYSDAGNWFTAGDVFAALQRALPGVQAGRADTWQRFAAALAQETGIDPATVEPASPLLLPAAPLWLRTANGIGFFGLILIGGLIVAALLSAFGYVM